MSALTEEPCPRCGELMSQGEAAPCDRCMNLPPPTCEDCGSFVSIKKDGSPPQKVYYSRRNGEDVYHDKDQCIFHLRNEIDAIKKSIGLNINQSINQR